MTWEAWLWVTIWVINERRTVLINKDKVQHCWAVKLTIPLLFSDESITGWVYKHEQVLVWMTTFQPLDKQILSNICCHTVLSIVNVSWRIMSMFYLPFNSSTTPSSSPSFAVSSALLSFGSQSVWHMLEWIVANVVLHPMKYRLSCYPFLVVNNDNKIQVWS